MIHEHFKLEALGIHKIPLEEKFTKRIQECRTSVERWITMTQNNFKMV